MVSDRALDVSLVIHRLRDSAVRSESLTGFRIDSEILQEVVDGSFSGGGLGFDTVDELYSLNDVAQQL